MKLLHVIPSLNPKGGGPIEGVVQIARDLQERGCESHVVCFDEPGKPYLEGLPLATYPLGRGALGYAYNPKLVPWLKGNLDRFDAVVIEGLWQYHAFGTWRALRRSQKPYFVFTHGMLDPWFKHTYPLKHLKKWLYWPWGQYPVLRDATAVLFTCEEERILARQSFWLYKANEVVVGYGTTRPVGDVAQQRTSFLSKYPELEGKRLFLFLSRIHEKKGCDLLIEAFANVSKKDEELHLVIAGPDQTGWKKELIELSRKLGVENRITWTGMISGDLKWGAFHAAEAFVLPSHQENFGVVVAEALACGVPTLISNKVNIWREVEAEGAGIVANDTLDGTTELFKKWIELDMASQAVMREKAVACFESRFEMGKTAQNLIDVIAGNKLE